MNSLFKIKIIVKVILNRLFNDKENINNLLQHEPNIQFDKKLKRFKISSNQLSIKERVRIRLTFYKHLQSISTLSKIKLNDINQGYYDQCLERYLYQKLNRSQSNDETCWHKYAQNNKCIDWINPNLPFNCEQINEYLLTKSKENKYFEQLGLADKIQRDENGFIRILSQTSHQDNPKIIDLYNKIKKEGFSQILSQANKIILSYSRDNHTFQTISGRHRMAVLLYLRSQNLINNITVKCHIIEHDYDTLVYTRPFQDSCTNCHWGKTFDPGKGTHQDFSMKYGSSFIRGKKREKGGLQKWQVIKSVFPHIVTNRTILDIGAHRGLYCIKALEYGAKSATALEINDKQIDILNTMKNHSNLEDLFVIKGDFFNPDLFNQLIDSKFDTVFLFGIIHHLLRIAITQKICLSYDQLFLRLKKIFSTNALIEFALPRRDALSSPVLTPYNNEFTQQSFELALSKHFSKWKNLGLCKYHSGNGTRYMYLVQNPLN
jgi:ribosomal protein L11 methylase PrmA